MGQSETLFSLICNDVKNINLIKPKIGMVRHSSIHLDYRKFINGIFMALMATRQHQRVAWCFPLPGDQGKVRQVKIGKLKLQD